MKNTKLFFAGMLSLSMILAGCSSNTEEKKEEVVEKTEEKEGEALSFTNSTSKTITSIQVKSADDKAYGKNLLEENLKDGAKADLYPEAKEGTKYNKQFLFNKQ
jgi:protein involved in sex pheromone biosynthesis